MIVSISKEYEGSKRKIKSLGFYRIEENWQTLTNLAKTWSEKAGTPESPFEALPSYISNEKATSKKANVLAIDIGGTSTKAAIRTCVGKMKAGIFFLSVEMKS